MSLEFTRWACKNGIKTDATYIDEDKNSAGRFLRASRSIKKGEKILFCPPNLIINNQFIIGRTTVGKYLMENPQAFDPMQLMMAFLILEFEKGEKSEFYEFISSLPRNFSLPVVWNKQLSELLPSEIVSRHSDFCKYVSDSMRQMEKLACKYNLKKVSTDDIMWAFCCVNTRCFYVAEHLNPLLDCSQIKNNMVLVPYLDMCNHSPYTSTDYDVNVDGCDIFATENIKEGSEISLYYGAHSNYVLLIEYGFVISDNPNDCVIFIEDDFVSAFESYKDVLKCSNDFEKKCKKELFNFSFEGEPSWALTTLLAALVTDNFDHYFEQYFSGYQTFKKQPKLLSKLKNYKINLYEKQLLQLKSKKKVLVDGTNGTIHWSVLKNMLSTRIAILKKVK